MKEREFRTKNRLLYPPESRWYLLKREGRTQSFTTLAIFENAGVDFDKLRHTETIEFPVYPEQMFTVNGVLRSMRSLAMVATHIAYVWNLDNTVYAMRDADELPPFYMDFTYKFYVKQIGDSFVPEANP